MIRCLCFDSSTLETTEPPLDALPAALQNPSCLVWVDFTAEPPATSEPVLRQVFGFHPLAIDDALQETHFPKVDDWGDYLYIVLHSVTTNHNGPDLLETIELDVFLGHNYMVTHHDFAIGAIEREWSIVKKDQRHLKLGADHLLYRVVDEVVSQYMTVVEDIDEEIEQVEDVIFDRPTPAVLEQTFALKRSLVQLRRTLSPQREVLNKLARDDYAMIDVKDRLYFRDVYDHLVRLHDITESLRDLASGSLDMYLSVINNRMNDIMKTLTLITTLFMPLSFVVGFFGMNFFEPTAPFHEWTSSAAFYVTLVGMLMVPVFMYIWMRRRGWM